MGEWPVPWEPLDVRQELLLLYDPIGYSGCRGTLLLKVDREQDLSLPTLDRKGKTVKAVIYKATYIYYT